MARRRRTSDWRAFVEHVRLMDAVDLSYPIILSADGTVMDGMHRVCQFLRLGRDRITARQFATDPLPTTLARGRTTCRTIGEGIAA